MNRKKKEKKVKRRGGDKGKEVIKSPILKNLGELFDLAEKIVPGTKDLQTRNEKLLHSVLKVKLAFGIIKIIFSRICLT